MITIRVKESDVVLAGALLYKLSPLFRGYANTAVKTGIKMIAEKVK